MPKNENEIELALEKGATFNEKTFLKSEGVNNKLILGKSSKFGTLGTPKIDFIGSNNTIELGERSVLKRGHLRIVGDNQHIKIGKKTTINGVYILVDENTSVTIGEDCMLSYDIEIRTTDAHSVIDKETRERINQAKSIEIGNRVWIGKEAMINKGVRIASNVIIGSRALVTSSCDEEYVAIAGVPARIVRTGVDWDRRKL
jgi:acetyltransferase-like isoleucine patch superfamily enzyme